MPINVFGNYSDVNNNKIDTSLFLQKPYLRTKSIESNFEEDIDLKDHYKTKKLPDQRNLAYEKLVVKIKLVICSTILVY